MTKDELREELKDEGTYKPSFELAIETLFTIRATIDKCRESIEQDGIMYASVNDTKKKNPAVELLSDMLTEQRQYMSHLGITPKEAKRMGKLETEVKDGFDDD